jgi:excisionase family DNA binding protein
MRDPQFTAPADRLLTADEVAEILHVTKAWVYDQTRQHRMPHVRLGRYVRYRRSAVASWIEQLEAQSISAGNRRNG